MSSVHLLDAKLTYKVDVGGLPDLYEGAEEENEAGDDERQLAADVFAGEAREESSSESAKEEDRDLLHLNERHAS